MVSSRKTKNFVNIEQNGQLETTARLLLDVRCENASDAWPAGKCEMTAAACPAAGQSRLQDLDRAVSLCKLPYVVHCIFKGVRIVTCQGLDPLLP